MKRIILAIKENSRIEFVWSIVCHIAFAMMITIICVFGEKYPYNYLVYPFVAFASLIIVGYSLIYKRIVLDNRVLVFFLFIIIGFLSTLIGTRNFSKTLTLSLLLLLLVVAYLYYLITKNTTKTLYCVLASFSVLAIVFTLVYRNEIIHLNFYDRLGTFFGNVNTVSFYFFLGSFFSLMLIVFKKHYWLIPVACFFALLMFSTGTKKTLLALFVSIVVIIFVTLKNHRLIVFFILVGLVALFIVLINLPFMATMKERLLEMLATILTGEEGASTWLRSIYMRSGFYLGLKNALLGYGNEGFAYSTSFNTYSHSNIAEIFCNYGLIGVTIFYLPFILILTKIHKIEKVEQSICISLVIIYSFLSFAEIYYYSKLYIIIYSLLLFFSNVGTSYLSIDCFAKPFFTYHTQYLKCRTITIKV